MAIYSYYSYHLDENQIEVDFTKMNVYGVKRLDDTFIQLLVNDDFTEEIKKLLTQ